jgi:hypothetical protein
MAMALVHAVLEMGDALERMRVQLDPDDRPADDGEFERFSRRYGELRAREMSDDELRANGLQGRAIEELRARPMSDEERARMLPGRPMNADERARTISQTDIDRAYERSMDNFQQPLSDPQKYGPVEPGSLDDPQQFREQPPAQSSFAPQAPRQAVRRGEGPRMEPKR